MVPSLCCVAELAQTSALPESPAPDMRVPSGGSEAAATSGVQGNAELLFQSVTLSPSFSLCLGLFL